MKRRKRYSKRKSIVEPVNGWIKSVLGFLAVQLEGTPEGFRENGRWSVLRWNLRQLSPRMEWR